MRKIIIISIFSILILTTGCRIIPECENIQDQSRRDYCYNRFAREKNDLSVCNDIRTQHIKFLCYSDIAIQKQEPRICNKIRDSSYRVYCYGTIAGKTKNLDICYMLEDDYSRKKCFEGVGYDLNIARNFCTDYCNVAKKLMDGVPDINVLRGSSYCQQRFDIIREDNTIDLDQSCKKVGVLCSNVDIYCEGEDW